MPGDQGARPSRPLGRGVARRGASGGRSRHGGRRQDGARCSGLHGVRTNSARQHRKPLCKDFTPLTSLAVTPLLDAAHVAPGGRLLDLATGPGVAASAAHERGAAVNRRGCLPRHDCAGARGASRHRVPCSGGDGSAFPGERLRHGDLQLRAWPLPDARRRVGRVRACPGTGRRPGFELVGPAGAPTGSGAIPRGDRRVGTAATPTVPQGHDTLRYSDPDALAGLLRGGGLGEWRVIRAPHGTHVMPDAEALWQAGWAAWWSPPVRVTAQDAATQTRARDALARRAEAYRTSRGLGIPIAFLIGTGRKL